MTKIEEIVERLKKIEGKKRMRESGFVLASELKTIYFEAHHSCYRGMVVNNQYFWNVNVMNLCPNYIEELYLQRYIYTAMVMGAKK
jgi:hypothetical protein